MTDSLPATADALVDGALADFPLTHPSLADFNLPGVSETLLVPLAARAHAARLNPDLGFTDRRAAALADRLAGLAERFGTDRFTADRLTMRASVVRAQWFDAVARDFLQRHPDGLCVGLGSGLDTRHERVGQDRHPLCRWVDLDLAPVTVLRRALVPDRPGFRSLAADLRDPGWIDALDWDDQRPALFLAEGVLMYLAPEDAEAVVATVCRGAQRRRAHLDLALDYASPLMVRNSRRPAPGSRGGRTDVAFRWALPRPADLAHIDARLRCAAICDVMAQASPGLALFNLAHRALTRGRMFYACAHFKRVPRMGDCVR